MGAGRLSRPYLSTKRAARRSPEIADPSGKRTDQDLSEGPVQGDNVVGWR
jgi:hypothetical protein